MSAPPQMPAHEAYGDIPPPIDPAHLTRGYGAGAPDPQPAVDTSVDLSQTPGNPVSTSPLSASLQQNHRLGKFDEDFDASRPTTSVIGPADGLQRSASSASAGAAAPHHQATPSRGGTLKKKASVSRKSSLKRSGSRKSLRAGSIKGVRSGEGDVSGDFNSAYFTPIPTSGSPTEILVNRFQAWRKLLKDLVTYFREMQTSYEARSKALLKVSNVINNTNAPPIFMTEGGLNDANRILRDHHKQAVIEANKARDIESEVIVQLSGLRGDLSQKIKEIKSLSGDFKNSVDKEKEGTRKAVAALEDALSSVDVDPESVVGKGDPYVVRLGVDRQVEKQIDEENYLHRAYLNLEGSGRELESIVVGEIQKAYNAFAGILKRDADEAYSTIERLKSGPLAMPKDFEWSHFVETDPHIIDPRLPLRRVDDIDYTGKHHPAAAEVRAGMLERKSKYLKSYTPGWYVLSPTHLHEFKSADRIYSQPPVMSLYLPDQKLGSHSQPNSASHKFMLKGRQTGGMHRGHSWVFRAESFDTMIAWFEDIRMLTEKTGEERNAYVRKHARSLSGGSVTAASIASSGDLEEDEADAVPYSAHASLSHHTGPTAVAPIAVSRARPQPGGRFPSDIQVDNRDLHAPLGTSSGSSEGDHDLTAATLTAPYPEGATATRDYGTLYPEPPPEQPAADAEYYGHPTTALETRELVGHQAYGTQYAATDGNFIASPQVQESISETTSPEQFKSAIASTRPSDHVPISVPDPEPYPQQSPVARRAVSPERHNSLYGEWMAPAAASTAAGTAAGSALGADPYLQNPGQPQSTPPVQAAELETTTTTMVVPTPLQETTTPATTGVAPVTTMVHGDPVIGEAPPSASTTLSSPTEAGERTPFAAALVGEGRPGIGQRQDTDLSLADLHVPGEYPRASVAR